MKDLLYAVLATASLCATGTLQGQIQLEHTYPFGSIDNTNGGNQLFLLELESSGWSYVLVDRGEKKIEFYHLDHSFWKEVSFSMVTILNDTETAWDILYISEHLFDQDDDVEFMFTNWYPLGQPRAITQIVDEGSGSLIFSAADQAPWIRTNYHQQQYPIQNTPSGTKLVLSGASGTDNNAYVYGLPGDFTTGMAQTWNTSQAASSFGLFPNPASGELSVVLSSSDMVGKMEIMSSDGVLQRVAQLSATSSKVFVGDLAPGAYVCRIQGQNRTMAVGSFVKE